MVDIRLETRQKTPTHAHGAHPGRFLLAAATIFGRRSHSLGRSVGAGGGVNEFDSHARMHERSPRWIFSGQTPEEVRRESRLHV